MLLDIAILIVMILFAVIGYKKGFVFALLDIFAVVVALGLSYLMLPIAVNLFESIIGKIGFSSVKVDESLKLLFSSQSQFALFLKRILKIDNISDINSVVILFRTFAYIIMSLLFKRILKSILLKLVRSLRGFIKVGRPDKLVGSILGFCLGIGFCSVFSFILMGFYSSGILDNGFMYQIQNSSLVDYLNSTISLILK